MERVRRILVLLLYLGGLSTLGGCAVDFSRSGPAFNDGYGREADYGAPDGAEAERRNLERDQTYRQWERRGERHFGGYGDFN
jgi:hypothetical protein